MTIAINTVSTPVRRSDPDRAGLRQAMRAEWTKLMSLRSTKLTLVVTLVVCVLGTFLSTNGAGHHARSWYQGFDPTNEALGGLAFSSLVIAVLSVLCMTSEYGSGTIRASLAATPRRSVFYGAKVLVFGASLGGARLRPVLPVLLLGPGHPQGGGAPTATLSSPGVLHVLILSSLFYALLSLFGFGLGAIIRHTAGAITTFYCCTLLTALILQNVPGNPGRFTPVMIFGNSVAAVVHHGNAALEHHRFPAHGRLYVRRRAGRGRAPGQAGCMMEQQTENDGVRVRVRGKEMSLSLTEEQMAQIRAIARTVWREPFTARPWSELGYYLLSGGLAAAGLVVIGASMGLGAVLAITFFGLGLLALSLRCARGLGRWQRGLSRSMLGQEIAEPETFLSRPGFLGWLQSSMRDRVAWRSVGYHVIKVPWTIFGFYLAFSFWWDAFACLTHPLFSSGGSGAPVFGPTAGPLPSRLSR